MPISDRILIYYVNIDEENFDELSKFVKISPVRILRCTVAESSKKSFANAIKLYIIKCI